MRSLKLLLATAFLACLSVVFALDGADDLTILQGLQESPDQFSTFLTMIDEAGLTSALEDPGPITVLAPTNAAFDYLDATTFNMLDSDPDVLAQVLNGLILPDAYMMLDLKNSEDMPLTPLSGEPYDVEVTAGGLKVNGVGFQATDVDNVFSNGVVHVTDTVILPLSLTPPDDDGAATDLDGTQLTDDATPSDTTGVPAATPAPPIGSAPGTQPDALPAIPTPEGPTAAFVRVVQLSPASTVHVVLTPQDEEMSDLDFGGIEYGHASDYREVEPGKYLMNANLPDNQGPLFDAPSDTFQAGRYYTVVITGLQVPAENAPSTGGDGFGGWLRNLFGSGDGKRDALAMAAKAYQDDVREGATDSRVRVIDAAPGSPAFDVVTVDAAGERHVLAGNMVYGDDSGAKKLEEDFTGLQITAADSSVVAMELDDTMSLPTDATIFLIGTTFEGVPYEMLVLPNGPGAAVGTPSSP